MIFNGQNAPAVLRALHTNLSKAFNAKFDDTPAQWDKVAMLVPSNGKTNDYAWMLKFPRMREWIGDKTLNKLAGHTYSLTNRDFETTIDVDRNDIEDDNLGIYTPLVQSAGESAKQWPDDLVFGCLTKGFVEKCYDGKSFYHASHELGAGKTKRTESNLIQKKLSIASLAAAKAGFGAARTLMRSRKDEEGRPLNINPNLLVVPPALEDEANALMTNDRLEDGKPNPYKGSATVMVVGWLETETEWHLLATGHVMKPIVFQQRKKATFVSQTDSSSDAVFMQKKFRFGAEARGESGYGLWQLAVGSTGTVD